MRKGRLLGALLLTASMLITACVAMPTSGEPQAFDLASPDTEPVEQLGFGPQRNSPPEQIISDFLRASAAGPTDDYATAKKYLIGEISSTWKPREAVLVYPTDRAPTVRIENEETREATALLEAQIIATVNESGEMSAQDGTKIEFTFDLFKGTDGQWRIASMEDGVILSQANFEASYQMMQLYFLAPGGVGLVPDPRWYPRRRMASYLVSGLLKGPSEPLQAAVSSALGDSLRLPTQGVEIDGQVARVHLEGEVPGGEAAMENVARQVTATLRQMKTVTRVETDINLTPLPEIVEPFWTPLELDSMIGVRQGSIVVSAGDSWDPILSGDTAGPDPTFPSRPPSELRTLAWLSGPDTVLVWTDGHRHAAEIPTAVAPSVDRWDWTWTATAGSGQIIALDPAGQAVPFDLPEGISGGIRKVAASPDGVRILLIVESGGDLHPFTAAIVRDNAGAPQRLVAAQPVRGAAGKIGDASWAGSSNLAVLSANGEEQSVTIVALGGFVQELAAPADARRISAGGQTNRILLETGDGRYYSRSGGVWKSVDLDVEEMSYVG